MARLFLLGLCLVCALSTVSSTITTSPAACAAQGSLTTVKGICKFVMGATGTAQGCQSCNTETNTDAFHTSMANKIADTSSCTPACTAAYLTYYCGVACGQASVPANRLRLCHTGKDGSPGLFQVYEACQTCAPVVGGFTFKDWQEKSSIRTDPVDDTCFPLTGSVPKTPAPRTSPFSARRCEDTQLPQITTATLTPATASQAVATEQVVTIALTVNNQNTCANKKPITPANPDQETVDFPPTSAEVIVTFEGIEVHRKMVYKFVRSPATGTTYTASPTFIINNLNGAGKYLVEIVVNNGKGSAKTTTNPADQKELAIQQTLATAPAIAAGSIVAIGSCAGGAKTTKSTTFIPQAAVAVALKCCEATCIVDGTKMPNGATLTINSIDWATVTDAKDRLLVIRGATIALAAAGFGATAVSEGKVKLEKSALTVPVTTWAQNAWIEGDSASSLQYTGAQTFNAKFHTLSGALKVSNTQAMTIATTNSFIITERVAFTQTGAITIANGAKFYVVTEHGTAKEVKDKDHPGLRFITGQTSTCADDNKETGFFVFGGEMEVPLGVTNNCNVRVVKDPTPDVAPMGTKVVSNSSPFLYCCEGKCGKTVSALRGGEFIIGNKDESACKGLTKAPGTLGSAETLVISSQDAKDKGGAVKFLNVAPNTNRFSLTNPLEFWDGAVLKYILAASIPKTASTVPLFDKGANVAGGRLVPTNPMVEGITNRQFSYGTTDGLNLLVGKEIATTDPGNSGFTQNSQNSYVITSSRVGGFDANAFLATVTAHCGVRAEQISVTTVQSVNSNSASKVTFTCKDSSSVAAADEACQRLVTASNSGSCKDQLQAISSNQAEESSDDDSNKGLWGLTALFALVILAIIAVAYMLKAKKAKADAQYEQDTAAFANVASAPTAKPAVVGPTASFGQPAYGQGYAVV